MRLPTLARLISLLVGGSACVGDEPSVEKGAVAGEAGASGGESGSAGKSGTAGTSTTGGTAGAACAVGTNVSRVDDGFTLHAATRAGGHDTQDARRCCATSCGQ